MPEMLEFSARRDDSEFKICAFITYFYSWMMQKCDARMKERAEELRGQVKSMFDDTTDLLQTMELIDSIQLLGLDYHFQKEISEALSRIHDADIDDHGLYHTALWFRLLRQHGHYVSPSNPLNSLK